MTQSFRLKNVGLVNRDKKISFKFNGKNYYGYEGDTLASALIANGVHLIGRSFKYHRPRGFLGAGLEEPNAQVQLYKDAKQKNTALPGSNEGYAFHSYETLPLPTDSLKPSEILHLRDEAFKKYHNHKRFLDLITSKFGEDAAKNIVEMTKISLKRKILGHTKEK